MIATWVVLKVKRTSKSTTVIHQTTSETKARNYLLKHIKDEGERPIRAYKENDEFGKGETIITKDKNDQENFYTTGEV